MTRWMLIGALLMTGCAKVPVAVIALPPITLAQRTPCLTPLMVSHTREDLARKMLRIAADRDCANAKIEAIDATLTAQENANGPAPRRNAQ